MRYAFFRGYMAGSDDERATDHGQSRRVPNNPYRHGPTFRYWQRGFDAGEKEAR